MHDKKIDPIESIEERMNRGDKIWLMKFRK
jgi:hypothetical protein